MYIIAITTQIQPSPHAGQAQHLETFPLDRIQTCDTVSDLKQYI